MDTVTLTAERVDEIFMDCLFRTGEPTEGYIVGEGVLTKAGFHPNRLASHKDEVGKLLAQLPDQFHAGKGDGWSFLNACMSRNDVQWGEHRNVDQLLMLGMATGLANFNLPRELWRALPGGVPYFTVKSA